MKVICGKSRNRFGRQFPPQQAPQRSTWGIDVGEFQKADHVHLCASPGDASSNSKTSLPGVSTAFATRGVGMQRLRQAIVTGIGSGSMHS